MFEHWQYRRKLKRLRRQQLESRKKAEQKHKREGLDGSAGDIDPFLSSELESFDVEMMVLRTSYLQSLADDLFIPLPAFDPKGSDWTYAQDASMRVHLTLEAMRNLMAEIRAEKNAGAESLMRWLPMVIGIIGAVSGLVSVIRNTH